MNMYLKLIVTAGLILQTNPATAASFHAKSKMRDLVLEKFSSVAQKLDIAHNGDNALTIQKYNFKKTAGNETSATLASELTLRNRSRDRYSRPEHFVVNSIAKDAEGKEIMIETMSAEATKSDLEAHRIPEMLNAGIDQIITSSPAVEFVTINDGNSFGGCSTAFFVNHQTTEILVISSCWSE